MMSAVDPDSMDRQSRRVVMMKAESGISFSVETECEEGRFHLHVLGHLCVHL